MYDIAICDDCIEYIAIMRAMLLELQEERKKIFRIYEFKSGEELVRNLDRGPAFDLLILDVQLDGMDGDETARIFRKTFPDTVLAFCSGICQPTAQSFKAMPFRYILKSLPRREIMMALGELLDEVERNLQEPYLIAHYRCAVHKIKLRHIMFIENAKRGGRVVLSPQCRVPDLEEKLFVDEKPEQLEKRLGRYGFSLAQSACLVNLSRVKTVRTQDFVFDNGEIAKLSRSYQKRFREAFVKYSFHKYF